jgi:hypothetical protein
LKTIVDFVTAKNLELEAKIVYLNEKATADATVFE